MAGKRKPGELRAAYDRLRPGRRGPGAHAHNATTAPIWGGQPSPWTLPEEREPLEPQVARLQPSLPPSMALQEPSRIKKVRARGLRVVRERAAIL